MYTGRHAIPSIVNASGNAVAAVGFYAGAAAAQGREEEDGAEGGK